MVRFLASSVTSLAKPRTVALVGSAKRTRDLAPWNDLAVEIWGINEALAYPWMKRASAMFQMHQRWSFTRESNPNDPHHWAWLQELHPFPVYMQEAFPDIPSAQKYPLAWVLDKLKARPYFTGTVAYMLALALAYEFERIELYGIELASDSEWFYQRDCVTYWLGIAQGRGVEIYLPEESTLLKAKLYGYEGGRLIERLFFEQRYHKLKKFYNESDLVLKTIAAEVKVLAELPDEEETKYPRLQEAIEKERAALVQRSAWLGALKECEAYLEEYDQLARAAGNPLGDLPGDYAEDAEAQTQDNPQKEAVCLTLPPSPLTSGFAL